MSSHRFHRAKVDAGVYQLTDRLHRRTARVSGEDIVTTLSAWLAELGATTPFVEDLARAVLAGDWPKAHALADYLSVDVTVIAPTHLSHLRAAALQHRFPVGGNVVAAGPVLPGRVRLQP
ncbi:hypothetical protein MFM001_33950 [Mycobacterium sp. MFM001]|nr:hypothetical protein MFM001_33950 [Mycobacterium sp. MFM001]